MGNFDLTNLALRSAFPTNKIITDDKGMPSVMVYIPKFKISDVITGGADSTHPAFIVNGHEVDGIYISKYQNVMYNGRAYSLPGEDPKTGITWDTARGYCEAKGRGWHMMTKAEWVAIALWCKKNGTMPKGNNNYGKDHTETLQVAIPMTYDGNGKINHVATGTGPVTWSHDGTPSGIWDLNGNVAEWGGGIRTVKGELQFIPNNNAADNNTSQTAASTEWKAIDATTGQFITPNGTGTTENSIKVDCNASNKPVYSTTITKTNESFYGVFTDNATSGITCSNDISEAAKAVLRAYGMLGDAGASAADYGNDYIYFNNVADERLFYCGGYFYYTSDAGVFCAGGTYSRAGTSANVGFRSAYIENLPTD